MAAAGKCFWEFMEKDSLKEVSFSFTEPSCSAGWVQHGKSCYIVINIPTAEWSAARPNCLKFGGDLAKIPRDDENQFLYNLTSNQTYRTHGDLFSQGSSNSMPESLKIMPFFVLLSSFPSNFQP